MSTTNLKVQQNRYLLFLCKPHGLPEHGEGELGILRISIPVLCEGRQVPGITERLLPGGASKRLEERNTKGTVMVFQDRSIHLAKETAIVVVKLFCNSCG